MSDEPLEWSLRVSRRARYARLRILPFGGLEVVIPQRFPRHRVAELVAEHADWARMQLARQADLRADINLPDTLTLAFDGSAIPIHYPGQLSPQQRDLFAATDSDSHHGRDPDADKSAASCDRHLVT